ncbi:serine protease [Pelagivirga sediminicola]|uniref:Serine protease n=1 Tax=Pelagivirga sediminicola TaxID=2170575 RepID=A0A2T7G5F0_9RHOB|nr:trypsin-like serine protease [Pelagivirga sediminicola]PVA09639.1 serine protease [Pelagivirga sediminicola]
MRLRAASFCAALLCAVTALPAAAGGLIRLTDRDDLFGWEAVGRLELGAAGYCTGSLIAPALVLTAAHCVYDKSHAPIAAEAMTFRAGLRDGEFISQSGVAQVVAHPGYAPGATLTGEMVRHDVALLKLADPIPSAVAGPFALAGAGRAGARVSVVSYGRGRDAALSWQRDCGIIAMNRGVMQFDCDVTFGSSGAPVFMRAAGGNARIVSLISSGGQDAAYGMELPGIVADLKQAMRAAKRITTAAPRRVQVGQGGGGIGAKFQKP